MPKSCFQLSKSGWHGEVLQDFGVTTSNLATQNGSHLNCEIPIRDAGLTYVGLEFVREVDLSRSTNGIGNRFTKNNVFGS